MVVYECFNFLVNASDSQNNLKQIDVTFGYKFIYLLCIKIVSS